MAFRGNSKVEQHVVLPVRTPRSIAILAFRKCRLIAVMGLLVLGGCGHEEEPKFVGVEEEQLKKAEEHKEPADPDTASQQ